ncbi:MAG: MarR family transcriptional regulator [Leifsonia sp.]
MSETGTGNTMDAADATLTASRALLGVVARSVAAALEVVTLPQFRILVVLVGSGPIRIGALAERMHAVPSTFSRTIDRMVSGGWVERSTSPDSRREVMIDASRLGRELVDHVTDLRRREISAVLSNMDEEDRDMVMGALSRFSLAAGEPAVEDLLTLGL